MARKRPAAPDARELDRLQRWMQEVITHPEGVVPGLGSRAARKYAKVDENSVESVVAPSKQLTSVERLQIYANQFHWRLIDVLAADFPTVHRVVGPEAFYDLVVDYLARHPPTSYSLAPLGAAFPRFLLEEANDLPHREFLFDVAVLERTMEELFDVEEAKPIGADALAGVPAERWPGLRLTPIPGFRLLAQKHPVNAFVRAAREERHLDVPAPEDSWLVVFRRDFTVWRSVLTREQHALLGALAEGKTLVESLEAAVSVPGADAEAVASKVQAWFREWAGDGLFAAVG